MKKQKASTLQQRLGFMDDDLKLAEHDQIMIWVNKNIKSILSDIFNKKNSWYTEERKAVKESEIKKIITQFLESDNFISKNYSEKWEDSIITELKKWNTLGDIPTKPEIIVGDIKWEYPVMSSKFIVGFIDLLVWFKTPYLTIDSINSDNKLQLNKVPKFIIGWTERILAVEVKTKIPSLGELIRQIRTYESYLSNCPFLVVSPSSEYKELLENQKILFYEYLP